MISHAPGGKLPVSGISGTSCHPGQVLISAQTATHEYLTLSGKVTRETVKKNGSVTDVLDFVYDESGRPFALNHSTNGGSSFTTYYYILNLQGDVVKLVTASGSAVATYEYDAWGNILSKSGTMADKNPLRYRGYYYDAETGFYYLQSRYYDPANRRFINADSYASTGQDFVGTNMFAYCGNSPIGRIDIGGCWWLSDAWEWVCATTESACDTVCEVSSDVRDATICVWNWSSQAATSLREYVTNEDEQVVLDADYFAFYKGVPVIKLPIGTDAFSFGVIFLGDEVGSLADSVSAVRHEYGHSVHFSKIGPKKFLKYVAIPSLIGYWTDVDYYDYYSQPWEYTADMLGGVNRRDGKYPYSESIRSNWKKYYAATIILPE